jgi:glycosyltransferase involved in cell wall biosynthesis
VLYAGAHGPPNNLETVVSAASLLQSREIDGAHFTFVGEGVSKTSLRQQAQREGIGNVRFEDPLPKSAIFGRMRSADAFVVLARNRELYRSGISPNKLFDYMACARPVILAADVPDNVVERSGGGLVVPPEDPDALAKAVEALLAMTAEERAVMGARGRRFVEEHHDMAVLAQRFLEALPLANPQG